MSERVKDYLASVVFFIMAIACMYGSVSGIAIGHATVKETRQLFITFGFALLFTTAVALAGNFRLNVWLRPKSFIEAHRQKDSPEFKPTPKNNLFLQSYSFC